MALEADAAEEQCGVIRETMQLAGVGLALGSAGSLVVARLLQSLLHGVSAMDGLIYVVMTSGVLACAFVAGYLPARRTLIRSLRCAQTEPLACRSVTPHYVLTKTSHRQLALDSAGFPGVSMRVLHQDNRTGGMTVLTKMEPGSTIPAHLHTQADETVLSFPAILSRTAKRLKRVRFLPEPHRPRMARIVL